MKKQKILSTTSEWSFELIKAYEKEIAKIAEEFHLDTYPNQIEIINSEQMMNAYSSVGMPLGYHHWSYGKQFVDIEKKYRRGHMGLAYEICINSNPCISYLMEENTMMMQALVIAHACYGHNSFFKGNYLFTTWTNADAIIDYLLFAKNYISKCEDKYGIDMVESTLDACHALMNYGVDKYRKPAKLSINEEKVRQKNREEYMQSQVNELWRTIPERQTPLRRETYQELFPSEPEENLLYFIEKNAPLLEPWQREIVRIVRKIAQYFYPQRQTKMMNEGWACFWHYNIINRLYDKGLVTDEFMIEFLEAHTNVINQPNFDDEHFQGMNPYTIGFSIFEDIKRICEDPSDEDKQWFPELCNSDWLEAVSFAMRNFKDESFITQYLSPHLIRKLKLFSVLDDDQQTDLIVTAIHNEAGYKKIRETLAQQYDLSYLEPNIQVYNVNIRGDRSLTLHYLQQNRRPLSSEATEVLKYLYQLWGFPVILETIDEQGAIVNTESCPPAPKPL